MILNDENVSIPKGTTGIITYRLLKYIFGREAVPLRITSTYLSGVRILVL